jgi:hypothetical protein
MSSAASEGLGAVTRSDASFRLAEPDARERKRSRAWCAPVSGPKAERRTPG